MSLTKEEIKKIAEAIAKVYEENGKKLQTATLVEGFDPETGEIEGENIIDNREEEELN